MQVATRPWVTAGVALTGATVVAATPLATPLPGQPDLQARAVQLTSSVGEELLGPWVDAFNTASGDLTTLADNFFLAPFVGLEQVIVNQFGFLNDVLNDPSSIGTVLTDVGNNLETVVTGLTLADASSATMSAVTAHSLDGTHSLLLDALTGQFASLGFPAPAEPIPTIIELLSSPLSGLLIGAAGPVISPEVALLNSIEAIVGALQGGDTSTALADLLAAPANVVGSFFDGATLNLDALIPLVEQLNIVPLPSGTEIDGLSLAFGGLLSPGVVGAGPYTGGAGDIPVVGGSILNSLGIDLTGAPIVGTLDATGEPVGPLGALEGISQTIGVLLGDGWDGKDAVQVPPLSGLEFPTLDINLSDINLSDIGSTLSADALAPLGGLGGDLATLPDLIVNALLGLF